MSAEFVLTAPFCSKNRSKSLLPIEPQAREFVIYTEVVHGKMHHLLKSQLELGWHPWLNFTLPKSRVKAAWKRLKEMKKRVAYKVKRKFNGKTIWVKRYRREAMLPAVLRNSVAFKALFSRKLPMEVPLTEAMIESLEHGAVVRGTRLLPPDPASFKVRCQVIFGVAKGSNFPPPRFCYVNEDFKEKVSAGGTKKSVLLPDSWSPSLHVDEIPRLKRRRVASSEKMSVEVLEKEDVLGVDVNRPGKHVVAVATPARALDVRTDFRQANKLGEKLKKVRDEISRVQKALASASSRKDRARESRLKVVLTLLHRRKSRLKSAQDSEVSRGMARVLMRFDADVLAVEDLRLDPMDKAKPVAIAITDMPKQEHVMENAVRHATAFRMLQREGSQGQPDAVFLQRVAAAGTSKYCARCGSELHSVAGNYDLVYCPSCNVQLDRHENAAQNIARRGELLWHAFLGSLGAIT
ncbi:MAG: zinc ribbon domain-containing protein [Candidatus Helarchaeales archaeon]